MLSCEGRALYVKYGKRTSVNREDYSEGKLELREKKQMMIALCKLIFNVSPFYKKDNLWSS